MTFNYCAQFPLNSQSTLIRNITLCESTRIRYVYRVPEHHRRSLGSRSGPVFRSGLSEPISSDTKRASDQYLGFLDDKSDDAKLSKIRSQPG